MHTLNTFCGKKVNFFECFLVYGQRWPLKYVASSTSLTIYQQIYFFGYLLLYGQRCAGGNIFERLMEAPLFFISTFRMYAQWYAKLIYRHTSGHLRRPLRGCGRSRRPGTWRSSWQTSGWEQGKHRKTWFKKLILWCIVTILEGGEFHIGFYDQVWRDQPRLETI